MTYTQLNKLWWTYHLTAPCAKADAMNTLLAAVRQRIVYRYAKEEQDVDDISQNVLLKVWKDLIAGKFDTKRGDFAAYVSTVARTERLMFHRSDRLVPMQDDVLECFMQDPGYRPAEAQDPRAYEDGK